MDWSKACGARLGSGPMIQIALELLLDYNLRELSGIGGRDGGRGGVW
jgi:hypothetical protein